MELDAIAQQAVEIPTYLAETYWWAYVHPAAVRVFERQWLVNLILWGNFRKLREAALDALGGQLPGRTLQVACVYGDLTPCLAARVAPGGSLDVVDVLPIQLENLARKLPDGAPVNLVHGDSARLPAADASYERVLAFFLLHEQPSDVRRATLREAVRALKPGGRLVVVDYHRPHALHPLRPLLRPLLERLEPFALDLWKSDLDAWLPEGERLRVRKRCLFGGLYQLMEVSK